MTCPPLTDTERLSWLRLARSENVGPVTFQQLLAQYGTAEKALAALPELARRGGLQRQIRIYPQDRAERHLDDIQRLGARLVASSEAGYPALLRHIDAAPPVLCMMGRVEVLERPILAIVGARNASAAGRKIARNLAADFASAGYAVASGLARGIDTAAHEASVATATIAVVAGGIDVFYPRENTDLQRRIANEGILVSEMMPGTEPRAELFPRRNRIISGISSGIVVVEAAMRSGSLITARLAAEQGRDVFAVPGSPLDPRSAGTNKLIRDGATLVRNAADVIEDAAMITRHEVPRQPEMNAPANDAATAADRSKIVALLGPAPVGIDDVIRESDCPPSIVTGVLLELEIAGFVNRMSGQRVALA